MYVFNYLINSVLNYLLRCFFGNFKFIYACYLCSRYGDYIMEINYAIAAAVLIAVAALIFFLIRKNEKDRKK